MDHQITCGSYDSWPVSLSRPPLLLSAYYLPTCEMRTSLTSFSHSHNASLGKDIVDLREKSIYLISYPCGSSYFGAPKKRLVAIRCIMRGKSVTAARHKRRESIRAFGKS